MREDLDRKLMKRFPFLYRQRSWSMRETCMCWGFAVGDGWFDILWQLSLAIEEELKSHHKFYRLYTTKVLIKDKIADIWNHVVYKLSPVGKQDIVAKVTEKFLGKKKTKWGEYERLGLKSLRIEKDYGYAVSQVKEKFGTLRFYDNGNDQISRYTRLACRLSAITCEECGDNGQLRGTGWLYTSCTKCCKSPWDYTEEEFDDFKDNTIEFLKWLDQENEGRKKYGQPLLTKEEVIKEFKGEEDESAQ